MRFPLVSIIVPVFNVENYIQFTIESVLKQSYFNWELILINDGSTDKSQDIINEFAKKDERIVSISQTNQGVSAARNQGINYSKGEFIVFLDSDDWLGEKTIEDSLKFQHENNSDLVLFAWFKTKENVFTKELSFLNEGKKLFKEDVEFIRRRSIGFLPNEMHNPVKSDLFNTPWAKLISAELIKNNKLEFKRRSEVGMEDVLFSIGLFQNCQRPTLLPEFYYFYRQDNSSSLSKRDTQNLIEKFKMLFKEISGFNLTDLEKVALNNRIALSIINIGLSICSRSNKSTFSNKIVELKTLLNSEPYQSSLRNLEIKYMPKHWKLFFILAKNNKSILLVLLIHLMQKLR
jgi:glycosyltransferase involved in cell wall biosynthesis